MSGLFYNLGRQVGPKVRKARWIWESLTGTQADAIRLEHAVGLDLAHEARQQLQIDSDQRTRELLEEIGYQLSSRLAHQLRSFRFEAYRGGQPNAFALPGGFIFVSTPLLELCQWNKDQIAFLLGHEMAHVVRGHAIERIVAGSAISAAARTAPAPGTLGAWLRNAGMRFLETAYSRSHELDADALGVRLAAAAGYEPQASIQLLSHLAAISGSADSKSLGEYFSTHPTAQARIDNIRERLQRR
jgi:predicted Zn-dependent protease